MWFDSWIVGSLCTRLSDTERTICRIEVFGSLSKFCRKLIMFSNWHADVTKSFHVKWEINFLLTSTSFENKLIWNPSPDHFKRALWRILGVCLPRWYRCEQKFSINFQFERNFVKIVRSESTFNCCWLLKMLSWRSLNALIILERLIEGSRRGVGRGEGRTDGGKLSKTEGTAASRSLNRF